MNRENVEELLWIGGVLSPKRRLMLQLLDRYTNLARVVSYPSQGGITPLGKLFSELFDAHGEDLWDEEKPAKADFVFAVTCPLYEELLRLEREQKADLESQPMMVFHEDKGDSVYSYLKETLELREYLAELTQKLPPFHLLMDALVLTLNELRAYYTESLEEWGKEELHYRLLELRTDFLFEPSEALAWEFAESAEKSLQYFEARAKEEHHSEVPTWKHFHEKARELQSKLIAHLMLEEAPRAQE